VIDEARLGPKPSGPRTAVPGAPTPPGELDLHLFNEGRHRRLWELLGGHPSPGGGASFAVWAPNARQVRVRGDWSGWGDGSADAVELAPQGSSGIWWGHDDRPESGHRYKYEVHGADGSVMLRADPVGRCAEVPPATASVLWAPSGTAGPGASAPAAGRAAARAERNSGRMSIYEVHLGSWRHHPDGRPHSARDLAEPLADWAAEHGFTHLEFLPVSSHPFGGSWGYQVSGYYAPDPRLGSPEDLCHLIEVCHDRGLGVLLDWVPAHFPKDEFALARFDGTSLYEHVDPRRGEHPDWGTLVFNFGRHEVRNFLVANALYWLEEFGVDGLRVDAVASMLYLDYSRNPGEWVPNVHGGREDLDAISFLQDLNSVVAEEEPGAVIVAEESTSWPGVTSSPEWGGLGFGRKWNMGWMHDTLTYFGFDPVHRKYHHHELTFPMVYAPHERWVLPLSHDEVVHGKGSLLDRMPGDEWQRFANLRCLFAWQWCHPGRQLVFMGSEFAQEREWSHERELDWWLLERPEHEGVRRLVADLNAVQDEVPALWAGDDDLAGTFWWLDADDGAHSVFSFCRRVPESARTPDEEWAPGEVVAVVANLTPVPRPGYRLGVPTDADWRVAVCTDDSRFGGSGHEVVPGGGVLLTPDTTTPWQGQPSSLMFTLPPLAVVALTPSG
jgi:1,4-alpha-glucan branching enzyme